MIHNMCIKRNELHFNTFSEFLKWKEQEERSTNSWYVSNCAAKIFHGKEYHYYYCNRAGQYRPRGKGERGLKSQGTSKIKPHCSASIKAIKCIKSNKVTVQYTSTHYNHEIQLGHLRINDSTRTMIADKLKKGITVERIIDDIRDIKDSAIDREHLVSRKDIQNIKKQFNIDGLCKHPNDFISVSCIVEEMEDTLEYNPVLLFKQQGEDPNDFCKDLELQDFILVVQTRFQRDMLLQYGENGVCMDATYKVTDYDFNLITLMVLDKFQKGIPVTWAVSNREDKSTLVCILESLKTKIGTIKPQWFMSDMAPQFFNAWKEVFMEEATKYLWCVWHVDRAWRDGLRRHISDIEQRKKIYHQLRTLMMEKDKRKFTELLTKFFTLNSNFPSFLDYFRNVYCTHCEQWAICYRIGTHMNTNKYSEAFHRVLKIVYLHHRRNRRVDYLIYVLLKIARDKAFEQLQKLEKGKISHRICDIHKRHRRAATYSVLANIQRISEISYTISSESKKGVTYTVQKVKTLCHCKLKCQFCMACSHMYSCTCLDSCTNTTVYKHIHLVHMQTKTITAAKPEVPTDLDYFAKVSNVLPAANPMNTRDSLLKKIENRLSSILSQCRSCEDTSCLESVCNRLEVTQQYLLEHSTYPKKRKSSVQRYETQKRFYSTKKRRIIYTRKIGN